MQLTTYSTFILVLITSSCSLLPGGGDSSIDVNLEELQQHWVHSYEEESQESDVKIYRPNGYKEFPASRFRMQYIFKKHGICEWFYLAPGDAHHFRAGKWQLSAGDNKVIIIQQNKQELRFRIVELNKEVLRLKFMPAESVLQQMKMGAL